MIAIVFLYGKKVYAFRFIGTYQAAIPAMVYAVVLTIIMGLTRQDSNETWLNNMLTFWPFVLIYVYIALILGVIILNCRWSQPSGFVSWKRDIFKPLLPAEPPGSVSRHDYGHIGQC